LENDIPAEAGASIIDALADADLARSIAYCLEASYAPELDVPREPVLFFRMREEELPPSVTRQAS
jgi:hypothetical protein